MWNLSFDAILYGNWSCRRLQTRKKIGISNMASNFAATVSLPIFNFFDSVTFTCIMLVPLSKFHTNVKSSSGVLTVSISKYERFKRNSEFDWSPFGFWSIYVSRVNLILADFLKLCQVNYFSMMVRINLIAIMVFELNQKNSLGTSSNLAHTFIKSSVNWGYQYAKIIVKLWNYTLIVSTWNLLPNIPF